MTLCHKDLQAALLCHLPTGLTSWPDAPISTVGRWVNKHSSLTRQHTSSCTRDLWTVKPGLECPAMHLQKKTALWPPLLALCHKHMRVTKRLARLQRESLGNPHYGCTPLPTLRSVWYILQKYSGAQTVHCSAAAQMTFSKDLMCSPGVGKPLRVLIIYKFAKTFSNIVGQASPEYMYSKYEGIILRCSVSHICSTT